MCITQLEREGGEQERKEGGKRERERERRERGIKRERANVDVVIWRC